MLLIQYPVLDYIANYTMKMGLQAQLGSLFLVLFLVGHAIHVHAGDKFETGEWKHAHGTHYEGSSDTFGKNLITNRFVYR